MSAISVKKTIDSYPKVVLSFGIFLIIFLAVIMAPIDDSKRNCSGINTDLNEAGLVFSGFAMAMSLVITVYSLYILKKEGKLPKLKFWQ
jgi:hypothetical protein